MTELVFKKGYYFSGEVNSNLAEIIGVILGDGSLYKDKKGKIHINIAFNKKEEDYLRYVKNLIETYFCSYKFCKINMPTEYLLRNVSVNVGTFLIEKGLKVGNKKINNVGIPEWIFQNKKFIISFLRGLFDTDGCVYRKYDNYAQIQFKFAGTKLIEDTRKALKILNFIPTKIMKDSSRKCKLSWKIYLSKQKEINRFMQLINPKNPKNWKRYSSIKNSGDAGTFKTAPLTLSI